MARRNDNNIENKILKEPNTQGKVQKIKKSDIRFKNTLIVVLLVICLIQAVYIVFYTLNLKENSVKKSFLTSLVDIQKNVSVYLSQETFNSYEAYNYSQILTASIVDENGEIKKIKDTSGGEMLNIVDLENKLDVNGVEYYAINSENIKTQLSITVPTYRKITWYISSKGDVKVKCDNKPNWWTSDLDGLIVGN